jgi:hypothetical protein
MLVVFCIQKYGSKRIHLLVPDYFGCSFLRKLPTNSILYTVGFAFPNLHDVSRPRVVRRASVTFIRSAGIFDHVWPPTSCSHSGFLTTDVFKIFVIEHHVSVLVRAPVRLACERVIEKTDKSNIIGFKEMVDY